MTDNKLNDLAMQMVNSMKTMDDFKQIQQLMLQQFINNALEAEMQGKHPTNPYCIFQT